MAARSNRMVRRLAPALAALLLTLASGTPVQAANELSFDWSEDWFTNVRVGATATGTYKIFSYPGPEVITALAITDTSGMLTVDASGCIGQTVNYEACYFQVTFSPTAAGTYPFQLTATSATTSTTQEFTAVSRDPYVELWTWDALDWGAVRLGETTSQWLYVDNVGNVPADVDVAITGDDAAAFSGPANVHIDAATYVPGQEWVEFNFTPVHEGDSYALVTWTAGDAVVTTTLHGFAYDVTNDDPESPIEITGPYPFQHIDYLPFATTSDAERDACPQQTNAVWYRYTAAEDTALLYMFGSLNPDLPVVATLDGACDIAMTDTTPYVHVMAGQSALFSIGGRSGYGTDAAATWFDARPLRHVAATLDSKGRVDRNGTVHLTGTATTDNGGWQVALLATVRQKSGHGYITAEALVGVNMDVPTMPWTLDLTSEQGKFVGGPVTVTLEAWDGEWEGLGTHTYLGPLTVRLSAPRN